MTARDPAGDPRHPAVTGTRGRYPVPVRPAAHPASAPPGGDNARPGVTTWIIDYPAGEPILTGNHRMNRYAANRRTRDLIELTQNLCILHRIPRLGWAELLLEYKPPPRRKALRHPKASDRIEDHDNLWPTLKAITDGLNRAGRLVDDRAVYIRDARVRVLPETHWMGQLRLTITAAAVAK